RDRADRVALAAGCDRRERRCVGLALFRASQTSGIPRLERGCMGARAASDGAGRRRRGKPGRCRGIGGGPEAEHRRMGAEFLRRGAGSQRFRPDVDPAGPGDEGGASRLSPGQRGSSVFAVAITTRDDLVQRAKPGPWAELAARAAETHRQTPFREYSMIRKSGTRFSDKIMLKQWARTG